MSSKSVGSMVILTNKLSLNKQTRDTVVMRWVSVRSDGSKLSTVFHPFIKEMKLRNCLHSKNGSTENGNLAQQRISAPSKKKKEEKKTCKITLQFGKC